MGKWAAVIALLAGGVWLLREVFGGPDHSTHGVDLTAASLELERRREPNWPPGLEVVDVSGGIAEVRLRLRSDAFVQESTLEAPTGNVRLNVWKLPLRPLPELVTRGEVPRLEGLEYTRLIDAATAVDEPPAYYVGDWPELGSVLLVVSAEGAEPPDEFVLRYSVYAADGFGDERLEGDTTELITTLRVDGDYTARSLALPPLSALRLGFETYRGGSFRARLSSDDATAFQAGILADGADLWAGTIPPEGQWLELPLPPEGVSRIEVRSRSQSLVFLEDPRLSPASARGDRPNVLLVLVDTLRSDRLTPEIMPRLSELRGSSISFDDCWATASWTLPSVTTLLTSNHGGQHRAWLNDQTLGPGIDTLGEAFQRAGYRTAAFTGGIFVSQTFGLDRGFQVFDSSGGGVEGVVARAEEWLGRAGAEPWFLLVHTYEVHAPYAPPEEVEAEIHGRYPGVAGDRPPEPQAFYDDVGPETIGLLSELYDAEARFTDDVLGAFLDRLGDEALNSMVVAVTSDHGEEFGEHGLFGHTDTLYTEQLSVPLFVRLPAGARGGERVSTPVSHLDFAPTLLDAAGLRDAVPRSFVGVSLLSQESPSPLFASRNSEEVGALYSLRADGWSLIEGSYFHPRKESGRPELYDMRIDRDQQNNRAVAGSLEELWERLDKYIDVYGRARAMPRAVESEAVMNEMRAMGYTGK